VLAVNQKGENPRQLYKKDGSMVWISNEQGTKDLYVALFNIGEDAHEVSIHFSSIGLKGKVGIRDLCAEKRFG